MKAKNPLEQTLIRTDKETVAKLRELAAGQPVTSFIRDFVAQERSKHVTAGQFDEFSANVMDRLDIICAVLTTVEKKLYNLSVDVMECPDIAEARLGGLPGEIDGEPIDATEEYFKESARREANQEGDIEPES